MPTASGSASRTSEAWPDGWSPLSKNTAVRIGPAAKAGFSLKDPGVDCV